MNLCLLNSMTEGSSPVAATARRPSTPAPKIVPFPGLNLKNGSISVKQLSSDGSGGTSSQEADIDIWVIPNASMEPLLEAETVLSAQERRHANRFRSDAERTRYIAVRTLLRLALSHRMRNAVAGGDWRFSMNAYGKPELCPDQANCSFSISHADGFSVVAIAPNKTIGVDAEKIDKDRLKHLPVECLSANEQDRLNARPQDDRYHDFFRLWTLKEAYTKALGEGMSRDFGDLEFNLDTMPGDDASAGADVAEDENYELLTLKYFEFNHMLAICLLDVAGGGANQPTKNLYLVEASKAAGRGEKHRTHTTSEDRAMPPYLQIIDQANPERIELYTFGDLSPLLHDIIDAQADAIPHQTAIEIDGRKMSYRELSRASNALANYLIGRGLSQGEFVALYQEKTADLIVSLLGVLKAGGAYLPVDPKRDPADAARIVDAYGARFVLTKAELAHNLEPVSAGNLVLVDKERDSFDVLASQEGFLNAIEIAPDAVSHVVFTSGNPDGVTVDNREAVNFVRSLVPVYGLDAGHRCYQDGALAMDVALEEICAMLSVGSTVVLPGSATPEATAGFLEQKAVTFLSTVPSALAKIEDDLPTVDVLIVGGERCSSDLAVKWALRTRRLVSLKRSDDRFPSFSIERETRAASRPRLLFPRASDRATA